jgi:uncharacterized alpha-E superfamily protein
VLLSRLAESAFWLARYLERAEDLSRAILVCERLRLDLPGQDGFAWRRLASLAGVEAEQAARLGQQGLIGRVLLDRRNPSSLLGALHAARENMRRARALLPAGCWHTFNPVFLRIDALDGWTAPAELGAVLAQVVEVGQQLAGQIAGGMLRDEGYAFLRMGIFLERADMTLRIATSVAASLIPPGHGFRFEDVRWAGLLQSLGAYQAYRRRRHARTELAGVLDLLLADTAFPRSYAHAVQQIGRELDGLPPSPGARAALDACALGATPATRAALDAAADDALGRLARLGAAITATYFSPVPRPSVAGGTVAAAARPDRGRAADPAAPVHVDVAQT